MFVYREKMQVSPAFGDKLRIEKMKKLDNDGKEGKVEMDMVGLDRDGRYPLQTAQQLQNQEERAKINKLTGEVLNGNESNLGRQRYNTMISGIDNSQGVSPVN